jgi:adenylate cyclase
MILTILGAAHTISRDFQIAGEHLERALAIDANYAWLWNRLGWLNVYRGQPDLAIQYFERAIRLSPFDPAGFVCLFGISDAHFLKGNYDKAIEWGQRGLSQHTEANWQLRVLVPALVHADRKAEASHFFEKLIAHYPGLTTTKLRDAMPFVPDMMDRIVEGLRLAGLPE